MTNEKDAWENGVREGMVYAHIGDPVDQSADQPVKRANDIQVGGNHYKQYGGFQPWDAWWYWKLNPFQAAILKYVVRYREKNGIKDLQKAKHFIDKLIELEENDALRKHDVAGTGEGSVQG
jgi:hypothetical protein